MFLALNEILKEKRRFVLIAAVIVLVSYLVFFLVGLAYGLASSYTRAVDKWNASGIILSDNANGNIGRSLLFENHYGSLLSNDVAPLGVGAATVEKDGTDDVSLFGIDTKSFLMPDIKSGREINSADEVVVSDELEAIGIKEGSEIKFQGLDQTYKVVGLVDSATFQTAPVVYMTMETWRSVASQVAGMTGMSNASTVSALVTRGDKKDNFSGDDYQWQTINEFVFSLPGYQAQVLTFSLMIGFLIGIAAFVLAIFIYILTMQKKSVFGVLKAEGVSNSYIGRSVMAQVNLLSIFGLTIGLLLAVGTGLLLAGKVPYIINPVFYIGIAAIFIICAAIGGIASVRSVTKIDPVEAIE